MCAECGNKKATIAVQWLSVEETELYCESCADKVMGK